MKYKIIKTDFNEKDGITKVVIQTVDGLFSGVSKCNINDMPYFSKYAGERYAEIRAVTKAIKYKIKINKIKLNVINNLIKDIKYSCISEEYEDTKVMERIFIQKRAYKKEIRELEHTYFILRKKVDTLVQEREKFISIYEKKIKDK